MAKGLGNSYGERTEEHPNRKVQRGNFGQGEELIKVGGEYHALGSITPEIEQTMSNDEWLRYNVRKFGHGGI